MYLCIIFNYQKLWYFIHKIFESTKQIVGTYHASIKCTYLKLWELGKWCVKIVWRWSLSSYCVQLNSMENVHLLWTSLFKICAHVSTHTYSTLHFHHLFKLLERLLSHFGIWILSRVESMCMCCFTQVDCWKLPCQNSMYLSEIMRFARPVMIVRYDFLNTVYSWIIVEVDLIVIYYELRFL